MVLDILILFGLILFITNVLYYLSEAREEINKYAQQLEDEGDEHFDNSTL